MVVGNSLLNNSQFMPRIVRYLSCAPAVNRFSTNAVSILRQNYALTSPCFIISRSLGTEKTATNPGFESSKTKKTVSYRPDYDLVQFNCSECRKVFYSETDLQKHQNIHSRQFVCSVCDKAFDGSTTLKNHIKRAHKECAFQRAIVTEEKLNKSSADASNNGHTEKPHVENCASSKTDVEVKTEPLTNSSTGDLDHAKSNPSVYEPFSSRLPSNATKEAETVALSTSYPHVKVITAPADDNEDVFTTTTKTSTSRKKDETKRTKKKLACAHCCLTFTKAEDFVAHSNLHFLRPDLVKKCAGCGAVFKHRMALVSHMQSECEKFWTVDEVRNVFFDDGNSYDYDCT